MKRHHNVLREIHRRAGSGPGWATTGQGHRLDPHGQACVCRLVADPPLHGYGRWRLEQQQHDGSWR
jgi:hypothetical protein